MFSRIDLHKLSNWLVVAVSAGLVLTLLVIVSLGGFSLLWHVRITLIQVFGFVIAATASWFFFMRLVHSMKSPVMVISMAVFVAGVLMFLSVSVGRSYLLQYPPYVQSYGPAEGPGLPLGNVFEFFRHIGDFENVDEIARDPRDVPPALNREPQTVQLALETREVLAELAPGITFNYWTFNGTVPGPMLRIRQGDTVEFTLSNHNSSLHNHNIDLHAVTGPGGGGERTIVAPGEEKSFTFRALNPGLYVYHCAVPNMAVHMAHGMYGLILVEPDGGLPVVDHEFYVMQGELFTSGALGRKGLQIFDARKMLDSQPEYVVFNGRTGALMDNMEVAVGDRVRLYIGNGGVAVNSSFHVVGEIFDTVYPEASIGGALLRNVQTTNIPAGGATIVEFRADYPGHYVLVDHALMRVDKGAWGILTVTGEADDSIFR